MRRCLIFLFCPALSGCLAMGYPDISATPCVSVESSDIRAFLVSSRWQQSGRPQPLDGCQEISAAPVVAGCVEPQWNAYFRYHYIAFLTFSFYEQDKEILLYRPGYETVNIPVRAWWNVCAREPLRVEWKKAPDLAAQVMALAQITRFWSRDKDVLHFGAQEYRRLADYPEAGQTTQQPPREELLPLSIVELQGEGFLTTQQPTREELLRRARELEETAKEYSSN
jgi:hypothetical protein